MKLYKTLVMAAMLASGMTLTSCGDDFLESLPTDRLSDGGTATEASVNSGLAAVYQILLFDSYANNNYESNCVVADVQSDDCYKGGGDAGDQLQLYNISLFQADGLHTLPGSWNIYTSGFARANSVINACASIEDQTARVKQYNAEAHFLRAYYVYMLWKYFGSIPFFTEPLTAATNYMAKQITPDEAYAQIISDVNVAAEEGVLPMFNNDDASENGKGRVNRAAALMLKARAVMYQKDQTKYQEVANDLATIINSGEYELYPDFNGLWDDEREFCRESIFESNQMGEGKTWSSGWQGYGTNLPAFISPNGLADPDAIYRDGWGFCPVRVSTYEMFAAGDTRRDGSINDWRAKGSYGPRFQDTGLFFKKYAARFDYRKPVGDQDLNYCNNLRIFRYAETLLNYAELVIMDGVAEQQGVSAKECFNQVRRRAFGDNGHDIANPTAKDIKDEYHFEFVGEGHRYYDLVRWGDAASVLTENDADHNSVRTWDEHNKYLPIPQAEIDKTAGAEFALKQNPGYN